MNPLIGLGVLIVAVLLAFPLFAISGKLTRNRRANVDPESQAEADRVFEAELSHIREQHPDA